MEELIKNIQFSSTWWAIASPLILIIIDVLTGVVIAWKNNNFMSSKMRAGLSKKFGELVYVIIGILIKFAIGVDLILHFAVGYICLMEISSLLENCDKLGVKLPPNIQKRINNEIKIEEVENIEKTRK